MLGRRSRSRTRSSTRVRRRRSLREARRAPSQDYVTEKWSHAWASGAVVVYVGSPLFHEREADYPPFINGLDFAGPGALAAYLHEVLANDTLWRRYAARGPPPNATRASGRHWGGITLDRHVCDACLAFYG